MVLKLCDWQAIAQPSVYLNFIAPVVGMLLKYILKKVESNTDPCGTPLLSVCVLFFSFPMLKKYRLVPVMDEVSRNIFLHGVVLASLSMSPSSQTVP